MPFKNSQLKDRSLSPKIRLEKNSIGTPVIPLTPQSFLAIMIFGKGFITPCYSMKKE